MENKLDHVKQGLNMGKGILLIGGGGHCHSVLDSTCGHENYERIGVVAKDEADYEELLKDPLLAPYAIGTDAVLPDLYSKGWLDAFITLGSVGNTAGRRKICSALLNIGFRLPAITDKSAIISSQSLIRDGVYIGKHAVVNAGSEIGCCSIINTGAIVEHDCNLGSFCHASPGAVLCGNVIIGDNSHIGAGAVVRQGIKIGKNTLIGAGSVVVKDIPDGVKAFGNPCRVVE